MIYSKLTSLPFTFYNQTHRLTDKWMATGVRESWAVYTFTGCQLEMSASASRPHVCLSLSPKEMYYL